MKGVTIRQVFTGLKTMISTHTPVKGVTYIVLFVDWISGNFNSHAREGRDQSAFATTLF